MLRITAFVLAAIVAVLAVAIGMQPDTYRVTRSIDIAAPPAAVHAWINDFHKWDAWSPWAKLDPNMKTTYSGAPAGPSASYHWTGNDEVGEGRMTILESEDGRRVKINLEFIKPFASTALTDFTISPAGPGSRVEWTTGGDMNFLSKAMCLFMGGMDKMIGPDFEKGLAQLKAAAEKP
jgi:carbon monoxide dehydrogenase subunit G